MSRIKHIVLIVLAIIVLPEFASAQKNSNKGDRYFDLNLFSDAIKYYELEIEKGGDREFKNYAKKQLAECYRILGEFEEAEKAYQKVLKNKKNREEAENYLNYGKSLKSSAKFAEAKVQFEEFIRLSPNDPRGPVFLQSCDSAQLWLDANQGKTVKNVERINSPAPDFSPIITEEGKLIFTSSREGSKKAFISFNGGMNIDHLDLYRLDASLLNSDSAFVVENMAGLNTAIHEGSATFTNHGKEVYFTRTVKGLRNKNTNKVVNTLQVFYSAFNDSTQEWSDPVSAFPFNSSEYSIGHPSISKDGNTIYFMSDMPKGFGGTDIYYCNKDENGEWTFPVNAGKKVNTFGYELFPYIAEDSTLYFSSNAHPGMGQLDIFSASYKDGEWGNVRNLQPPINSIGDDFGIVLDGRSKRGFFSSDRFNGIGAEDIYSFSEPSPLEFMIVDDKLMIKNTLMFDGVKYSVQDTSGTSIPIVDSSGYLLLPFQSTISYQLTAKKSIFSKTNYNITVDYDSLKNSKEIHIQCGSGFDISFFNSGFDKEERTVVLRAEQFDQGKKEITLLKGNRSRESVTTENELIIEY